MAVDYKSYDFQVYKHLVLLQQELKKCIRCPKTEEWLRKVIAEQERIKTRRFCVAVVGEFKRGKSSFINALLGQRVLPVDISPTTAVINRITYGDVPKAHIYCKDGSSFKIEIEQLSDYVTKLTEEAKDNAAKIKEAVIEYPTVLCQNYVDIIDTPGMNDDDNMSEVTMSGIKDIDLAIVAVSVNYPFSETECGFMIQLLENPCINQIIVAVTYIDTVKGQQQREKALSFIKDRIKESVLEKLKEKYSDDNPIFQKYDRIFGNLRQFGVSSVEAMEAYEEGDYGLLESSGFLELKKELPRLIISGQNNNALQRAMKAIGSITEKYMDGDTVKKSCEKAIVSMKELKDKFVRQYTERVSHLMDDTVEELYSCIDSFREWVEKELKIGYNRCIALARAAPDTSQLYSELNNRCSSVQKLIGDEIYAHLNPKLRKLFEEKAVKAVKELCSEMEKTLVPCLWYFGGHQEILYRLKKSYPAKSMSGSHAVFKIPDNPEILQTEKEPENKKEVIVRNETIILKALDYYCKMRKNEISHGCGAFENQVSEQVKEIAVRLDKREKQYETAVMVSLEKIHSDKELKNNIEKLHKDNEELYKQLMYELDNE